MRHDLSPDDAGAVTSPPCDASRPLELALAAGTHVGEYLLERKIGSGGCGVVYLARHRAQGRRAAIKILHAVLATKPKMVERFVREALVVNVLGHPNIAAILELGKLDNGRPYCVMEHLSGSTLDAIIRSTGRLTTEEALDILEPICEALQAAHEAGIVHRDVKPSNVMICEDGGRRTAKLLDFGIAKLTDPELGTGFTSAGRSLGTIGCMAPEQITCDAVDARADVYALGVLLYRILTGRPPFWSLDPSEVALHHLETPAPRVSQRAPASPAIDAVVLRAMEKKPANRFESAQSFLDALREAVGRAPARAGSRDGCDAMAAAIYVELRFETDSDDLDDELAADIGRALDIAEERLRAEGFTPMLATGSAVLAARPLPSEAGEATRERRRALTTAASIRGAIEARQGADARVTSAVCAHVGGAVVRSSPSREVIGGAVTRMTLWSLPEGASGVYATPEALGDVADSIPIGFTYNLNALPLLAVST